MITYFRLVVFTAATLPIAASSLAAADEPPAIVIERAPDTPAPENESLRRENQRLTSEIADLRTKLETAQATIDVLTTKNQQLDTTLSARTTELRQVKDLLATAETRAKELAAAGTANTAAATQVATLRDENTRLTEQQSALEQQLNQLRQTETDLRQQLSSRPDHSARLAAAEAKLADAQRAATDETSRQTAALEELRQRHATLEADLAKAHETETSLRQQLTAAKEKPAAPSPEIASRLADLENKLTTAVRSYSLAQAENDRLKTAAADAESLRADKAALEQRLAAAPAEDISAKLAETESKLNTALRSFTQLQTENERLKGDLAEVERLRTEIETLRADKSALETRLAESAHAPAAVEPSPDLSRKLADTESKLNTVLRSFSQLEAENRRLKSDAASAASTAQTNADAAAGASAAQASALFDELRQTRAQLSTLALENSELRTRLAISGPPPGSALASPTRPGSPSTAASSRIAPQTAPTPQPAQPREHVVVLGDTLARISRHYYGNPNRWQEILEANRDVIQNENALTVGATLRIP